MGRLKHLSAHLVLYWLLACRNISTVYLLTDEHPSAAQREQSVETLLHMFEVGHWQWCMELSITAVLKSGDSKGYDTIHHRYLPHPLIHSPCAGLGDIFKTQICFRNTTLIHILQWFPVAHRKKKKNPDHGLAWSGPTYLKHFLYHSSISALQPSRHYFLSPKEPQPLHM